jgi:hypothetical protein
MSDIKSTIVVDVDASGVTTGVNAVKRSLNDLGGAASGASAAMNGIGANAEAGLKGADRATKALVAQLKNATIDIQATGKALSEKFELKANSKGLDPSIYKPYLDQLRAVEVAQARQASAAVAAAGATEAAARKITPRLNEMGLTAGQLSNALRNVPAQFTDIFVSLQSGQQPLTVLLQQGGQLKDMFGGVGNAAKAMGTYVVGLITPFTAAAAAIGTLAVAYYQGAQEAQEFNKSLILTGNMAGTTVGRLQGMAAEVSKASGSTIGAAAQALAAFASTGNVAADQFTRLSAAAIRFEKATGTAVAETVKQFSELGKDPLAASLRLNESTHFLTQSVYAQIKALTEQGKLLEAGALAQNAWASAIEQRMPAEVENLGYAEKAWKSLGAAAAAAWDQFKGVGRTADPVAEVKSALEVAQARLAQVIKDREGTTGADRRGRDRDVDYEQGVVNALKKQVEYNQNIESSKGRAAAYAARRAKDVEAEINADKEHDKYLGKALLLQREINKENLRYASESPANKNEKRHAEIIAGIREKYNPPAGPRAGSFKVESDNLIAQERQRAASRLSVLSQSQADEMRLTAARASGLLITQGEFQKRELASIEQGEREKLALLASAGTAESDAYYKRLAALKSSYDDALASNKGKVGETEANTKALAKYRSEVINLTQAEVTRGLVLADNATKVKNGAETLRELQLVSLRGEIAKTQKASDDFWRSESENLARIARQTGVDDAMRYASPEARADLAATAAETERLTGFVLEHDHAIELLSKSAEAYANVVGPRTEAEAALEKGVNDVLAARIKLRDDLASKVYDSAAAAGARAVDKLAKDNLATLNKSVADAITTGLVEGGEVGAKALREVIIAELKKPISIVVQALIRPVTEGVSGAIGSFGSFGSLGSKAVEGSGLLGKVGSYLGTVEIAGSSLSAIGGSFSTGISAGFAGIETSAAAAAYTAAGQTGVATGLSAGSAVGSALAAIPVWGWALLGAAALGDFGGGKEYTTGQGLTGKFNSDGFSGRNFQDWQNDGSKGLFGIGASGKSSGTNYSDLDSKQSNALGKTFNAIQKQTAQLAESLGASTDAITGYSQDVRLALGADAEANKKAIEAMFKSIADGAAATVVNLQYVREGEGAADTLLRLSGSIAVVNGMFDVMGKSLLGVSQAGGDVASQIVDALGGLEKYQTSMAAYYEAFYTEEERHANTLQSLQKQFGAMNIALPESIEGYRDLVNAQDVSTEAGRKTYATLINLSGAFATIAADVDTLQAVLTSTAGGIKKLVDSIAAARTDIIGDKANISPSGVMSAASIRAALDIINATAGAPSSAALDSANATATGNSAAAVAAAAVVAANSTQLGTAQTARESTVAFYQNKNAELRGLAGAYSPHGTSIRLNSSGEDNAAYNYNPATNRLNPFNSIGYTSYTNTLGWASTTYSPDVAGLKADPRYRALNTTLSGGDAALASAAQAVVTAQAALTAAQNAAAQATTTKIASDQAAARAALDYAGAVDRWAAQASKSVPALQKLREETVKYYESQKALAQQMSASANSLREAVRAARGGQLDAAQSTDLQQRDFAKNYALALATSGSDKANYADKLTAALPGLTSALQNTASSRADWAVATSTLFAQSGTIADQLESSAPANYQADSLALLDGIDASLVLLDDSTRAITRAIESSGGLTAAGLRAVVTALGGTPAFAAGGFHAGGMRLVGENGPELEVTGPSRIYNASQTRGMFSSDSSRLEALVERLTAEVSNLRIEARATASNTNKTAKILERVTPDGNSLQMVAA